MPIQTITFKNRPRRVPAVRVYLRANWDEEWVAEENLRCDWCAFTCNPDLPKAQLSWRYGRQMVSGDNAFTITDPLSVLRSFVKIEIDDPRNDDLEEGDEEKPPITWYGLIEDDSTERKQILGNPLDANQSGVQTFTAHGLDFLLARQIVDRSMMLASDGTEAPLERALEFNARNQLDSTDENVESGNRTPEVGPSGVYLFATDLATAKFWSSYDAAEYLLHYQTPPDEEGDRVIVWRLDAGAALGNLPDWDKPRKPCHARSLKQLCDELINRRRMLGYTVSVDPAIDDDSSDEIIVNVFTFATADVTFDGNTIPANFDQRALLFDADAGLQMAVIKQSTADDVDQVVCTGDRVVACFTMRADEGEGFAPTLVAGWSSGQETSYEAGASGLARYAEPSCDRWEKELLNERARDANDVKRVYSYFSLPTDWNGKLKDAWPYFFDPEHDSDPLPFYFPQLRLLSHLPLKTDHAYTGTNIFDSEVPDNTPAGQKWEYRPMLVAIGLPNTTPQQYRAINALSTNSEIPQLALGTEDGIKWSASVRTQEDAPGFVLTISGQPQHVIASEDFTKLDDDEDLAKFDWHTLVATVAIQGDRFVEGRWPETPATSQSVRKLLIDLGDEYKQHYVAGATMVGVAADGTLELAEKDGFIRDDAPKLKALARLAYEWLKTDRRSMELNFGYLAPELRAGHLVTTIGQGLNLVQVNSVVTMVRYEFPPHPPDQPGRAHTTITTQFAELDARRFVASG